MFKTRRQREPTEGLGVGTPKDKWGFEPALIFTAHTTHAVILAELKMSTK